MIEKTCGKCHLSKPREEHFNKDKSQEDGYCRYCRACRTEKRQKWYAEHREEKSAIDRAYREQNKEKVLARAAQYREENADTIKAYFAARYASDPEYAAKKKAAAKKWEQANPEKKLVRQRAYNAKHRWRMHLKYHYGLTEDEYNAMAIAQDGKCAICHGEPTGKHKKLLVDHNHATDAVRQLVCYKCNLIVGLLETTPERFDKALDYIARHA